MGERRGGGRRCCELSCSQGHAVERCPVQEVQAAMPSASSTSLCQPWLPGKLPWEVALHSGVRRSGEAGEQEVSLSSPGNGEQNHSSGGVSARETHLQS